MNDRGLSRKHIMESIEGSLRRLRTDYVDLYQAHRYDFETPLDETMLAFADLVRAGKVLYVGVSEWTAEQIERAGALARITSRPDAPIGDVLLDQRVVAGIGNVLKSEVLFLAGANPFARAASFDDEHLGRIIDVARATDHTVDADLVARVDRLRAAVVAGDAPEADELAWAVERTSELVAALEADGDQGLGRTDVDATVHSEDRRANENKAVDRSSSDR